MFYAGIDMGSRMVKMVVVNEHQCPVFQEMTEQSVRPAETAKRLFEKACKRFPIAQCIATGYARQMASFADSALTEITCHAKGCVALYPRAEVIIEVGGQDSKLIWIEKGGVRDFVMNDRCAAGTGRFLETAAVRLGLDVTNLGDALAETSKVKPVAINNMCVVFAETEIIGLLTTGTSPASIMKGVQNAVATRLVSMMGERPAIRGDIVFTGGVACVQGMKEALRKALGKPLKIPAHPQFTGALGAALLASR